MYCKACRSCPASQAQGKCPGSAVCASTLQWRAVLVAQFRVGYRRAVQGSANQCIAIQCSAGQGSPEQRSTHQRMQCCRGLGTEADALTPPLHSALACHRFMVCAIKVSLCMA